MHFLVTHVKKCIRSGRHICPPLLRLRIKRPTSGPEAHPHSLWKEGMGRVDTESAGTCPSEAVCGWGPRATPGTPRGRAVSCPLAGGVAGTGVPFLSRQWQVRRLGPGPAGPLERTGVTWEAKPTGYLGPLSLGVIFCKDGSCLIGQRYVPQPEALRAQQAKEKKNGDLLWEIPVRDICGFFVYFFS